MSGDKLRNGEIPIDQDIVYICEAGHIMQPRVFRCTRGHETTNWHNDLSIHHVDWKRTFCLKCIEELLVKNGCGEFK